MTTLDCIRTPMIVTGQREDKRYRGQIVYNFFVNGAVSGKLFKFIDKQLPVYCLSYIRDSVKKVSDISVIQKVLDTEKSLVDTTLCITYRVDVNKNLSSCFTLEKTDSKYCVFESKEQGAENRSVKGSILL